MSSTIDFGGTVTVEPKPLPSYSRRGWQRKMARLTLAFRAATVPSLYQVTILAALQDRQMYAGTVPAHVKARRRAQGRVAKHSRKVNRGH